MLYRQKFDTYIRIYNDIGYITNNSGLSDRVVSQSGAVFLSVLSREPQSLDDLAEKINKNFIGTDVDIIKQDAKEFFDMLEQDDFLVSGETPDECDQKDTRFSYRTLELKAMKNNFTPVIIRAKEYTHKFLEEYFKDKPTLTNFQIELTSKCNERCVHCYIPHENKKSNIKPELFFNILEQCREMGVLSLTLSGGEPMLHPNFVEFLRKAKEYDFALNVLSNLTLLNDEIIIEMKANRLSSVQVSLYSMNGDIHDSITQVPGSFVKTREAILKLIENDIPLLISCPVMKQNKSCCADVIKWAEKHKVPAATDYIMMARYNHTTDNLENRLSLKEVEDVITDIIENDPDFKARFAETDFTVAEKRDTDDEIICGVCISSICMIANGNIYPCAGWQDYICGNVNEQSLREIWEYSPKVQYLRSLRKKNMPECINCIDRNFCAVCMVRNGNEDPDGDFLKINKHFCKVAALNRKMVLDWKDRRNMT
jgi:radical SAM protein with 4Fe4S-binding SPASM domain